MKKPKKRRRKDIETAIKMVVYPPVIVMAALGIHRNKMKKRGKRK
jgi:hypothetical protein